MEDDINYSFKGVDGSELTVTQCRTGVRTGDQYIDFHIPSNTARFMRIFTLRGMMGGGLHSARSSSKNDPSTILANWTKSFKGTEQQVDWPEAFIGDTTNFEWRSLQDEDRSPDDPRALGADFFIAPGSQKNEWLFGAVNRFVRTDNLSEDAFEIFKDHLAVAIPIKIDASQQPLLNNFFTRLYELGTPGPYITSLPENIAISAERYEL